MASATVRLGHFWKAQVGQFRRAPKGGCHPGSGKRTISSLLRITGRHQEKAFQNYHRVLNRAAWNLRRGSEILLRVLVQQLAPKGPLLFGIDDTIERRWGP